MSGLILDVIVVVVVVLLLIFGIWRGAYKMIFGLVSSLLAIILTLVLLSTVTGLIVEKTTLDERLVTALEEPLVKNIPNPDVDIMMADLDGDGEVDGLGYYVDGELHPFSDLLEGSNYSLFSGVMEGAVKGQVENAESEEGITFGTALSATLVGYIISAITFIVLLIVFAILVHILMSLLKKLVTRTYIGHFVNKALGAVLGLVLAAIIVWGSLAIIRMLGTYEWIIPVNQLIQDSTLTKILFENNFIYDFIVNQVNLTELVDGILGGGNSSAGGAEEALPEAAA